MRSGRQAGGAGEARLWSVRSRGGGRRPHRQARLPERGRPAGGFYRFTPNSYPDLSAGTLEVAERAGDGNITWHKVPDPTTTQTGVPVNLQVPLATKFNGGEGLWYANGVVYYSTKGVGDKRVYAYSIGANNMEVIYDFQLTPAASQENVDNVTVTAFGEILVCEDGNPDPEVGLITPGPDRTISPLVRFTGAEHVGSELCGVVFNPSQTRLYVTSQRAAIAGGPPNGAIYEISGPFRIPSSGIPADLIYGPPVGEPAPKPEPNPTPSLRHLRRRHRSRRRSLPIARSPSSRSSSANARSGRRCSRADSRSASPSTSRHRSVCCWTAPR